MKRTLFLLALAFQLNAYSQNDAATLQYLVSTDSSLQIVFNHSQVVTNAAIVAATYPQGFLKLEQIQKTTSASFKNLLSAFNQKKQKELWDIARFPEIIPLLIENKDKRRRELSDMLKNYPKETREAALHFVKRDYEILIQMRDIQQDFNSKYADAVKDFPYEVKRSYDELLHYPDVLSELSENMGLTKTLGDLYKKNPVMVKNVMDSVQQQRAIEYNKEYEDWQNGIKNDPDVQNELKQVSKNYKKQENINDNNDDVYSSGSSSPVINDTTTGNTYNQMQPYPYWAGYPYWYTFPYWYPGYPWWFNTGFYWYPSGMFFLGMPSYYFGWWYYNHPRGYYNRYPHATNYFYNHYQNHIRSNGGFNRSIGGFYNGGRGGNIGGGFHGGGGGFHGGRR